MRHSLHATFFSGFSPSIHLPPNPLPLREYFPHSPAHHVVKRKKISRNKDCYLNLNIKPFSWAGWGANFSHRLTHLSSNSPCEAYTIVSLLWEKDSKAKIRQINCLTVPKPEFLTHLAPEIGSPHPPHTNQYSHSLCADISLINDALNEMIKELKLIKSINKLYWCK